MLMGGGGGYFAVTSGALGGDSADAATTDDQGDDDTRKTSNHGEGASSGDFAFVPLDPLIISLPPGGASSHLRFAAQLEVDPQYQAEVEAIKPRVVDVLNGYLRAVETSDFEDPSILVRLRAQMLRRAQVVTGDGRVRDLLIMEFVLN